MGFSKEHTTTTVVVGGVDNFGLTAWPVRPYSVVYPCGVVAWFVGPYGVASEPDLLLVESIVVG